MSRSTFFAASASVSGIVFCGTIVRSEESTAIPASSIADRTLCRSVGGHVTRSGRLR